MRSGIAVDKHSLQGCIDRLGALIDGKAGPGSGQDAFARCLAKSSGAGAGAAVAEGEALLGAVGGLNRLVAVTRDFLKAALDSYEAADAAASAQASRLGGR
jgi:hypothetical protein